MKKRILSIILSIVMLVGLLPTTALAAEASATEASWVFGASGITPDYTDAATGTLTEAFTAANANEDNTTIYVQLNENVISEENKYFSLGSNKSMVLDLNEKSISSSDSIYCIYTLSGSSLTVKNGTITVNETKNTGYGFFVNGALTVEDCTINAEQTSSNSVYGINGRKGSSLTVRSSSITAKNTESSGSAYGIYADQGTLTVENCNISAESSNRNAYGINTSYTNASISEGTISAQTNSSSYRAYGVYSSYGSVTLSGTPAISATTADFYYPSTSNYKVVFTGTMSAPSEPYSFIGRSGYGFTSGAYLCNINANNFSSYFKAADPAEEVIYDNGELKLVSKPYVSFYTGDGTDIDRIYLSYGTGGIATRPADPTWEGYTFAGWYTDGTYATEFDFDQTITQNTRVYAKWTFAATGAEVEDSETLNGTYGSTLDELIEATLSKLSITVTGENGASLGGFSTSNWTVKEGQELAAAQLGDTVTFVGTLTAPTATNYDDTYDFWYGRLPQWEGELSIEVSLVLNYNVKFGNYNYTTNSDGIMAYTIKTKTFDIIGYFDRNWRSTTYGNGGYETYLKVGDTVEQMNTVTSAGGGDEKLGLNVAIDFAFLNNGQTLQIKYTVNNTTEEDVTFSMGSGADVKIGSDDDALITPFADGSGYKMVSDNYNDQGAEGDYAQFNFFGKGYAGVTDVTDFWYGGWSSGDATNGCYWTGNKNVAAFYGVAQSESLNDDSAASWHWDDSIGARETKTYSILIGIGGAGSENAAQGGGLTEATGSVTIEVSEDLTNSNQLVVKLGNITLTEGTDYTVDLTDPDKPVITFNEVAGLNVSSGDLTVTVTFADQGTEDVIITNSIPGTGNISTEEGVLGGVTAEGLDELAKEQNQDIVLTVKEEEKNTEDVEHNAIDTAAGDKTVEFLDITLKDKNSGALITGVLSKVVEIAVPFDDDGKSNVTVYRYHDSAVNTFTMLDSKPADAEIRTDGTFFVDGENNKVYIYTNQFSTYAIGYTMLSTTCTVTFDMNGHGTAIDPATVNSGEKVTKPADPTATGYTFGGWYKEQACTTAWDFDTDTVSVATTLYAKWTEKATVNITETTQTYTWDGNPQSFIISGIPNTGFAVQYKVNGNWTDTAPSAVGTYDVKITRAEDDTYKAYEKEINGGLVIKAATPTANAPTAIIGLIYNGSAQALITEGSATGGSMMYAIGTAEQVTGEWSTDTPTGTDIGTYYVWYKIVGDGNHNNKAFETPIMVTIAPNTYIVTYLPGINGTGTQTTDTKTQGVVLTLSGAIFTRIGYTQTGWATTDGGAQAYALGASYTDDAPITLYPVWTANTNTAYTVEHWQQNVERTDYVKVDTDEKNGTTGAETVAAAKTYTGFTAQSFNQVAIAADGGTVVKIYYNRNTYTVTYTDNGVFLSNVTFEDVVYGAKAPAYPDTPTRTGYTFGGWYKDSGLTTAWDFENDTITGPTTIYAKWMEKANVSIDEDAQTYTWDSNPKSFAISGTPNTGFTVQYKVNGNWTTTAPSAVGTYDVKITRAEDDTYKAYEKIITGGLVIRAATPTADAPTAINNLVYDGEPHNLISSETSEHGYWEYSLDGTSYSSDIPTGTDAKAYTVYCRFVPNTGYSEVNPVQLSVTIAPLAIDEPAVVGTYTYTGNEQTVTLDGVLGCMTVSGNKATHAGDYEVSIALDGNHKWNTDSDGKIAWSIVAKTVTPTAALEYASIIYSGSERKPAVTLTDGDIEISVGEYTVSYSNNVNVGTAIVTITDKENGNYTFAEITKTFEIMRDGVSLVVTMDNYVYGGTPAVPNVSGNNGSGTVTVYYSTDSSKVDKLWEDISGTTLNVGTYYMKAHVASTDNYAEGISPVVTFKVTPGKYEAPSAPTASEFTVTVNEADRGKILEYSLDGANWISVPALTNGAFELKGLSKSTQYTVYLRVKASADGNYQASDAVSTVWTTPARYSVAYHANLGTGNVPASVTQNSGRSVTVARGSDLKRTGYTFAGWNTAADGTGTDYASGSTISTGATLYAKWTANSYTVKFKANGGSGTMGDQSFTYDTAQALTGNAFTRDGYHFAGWALASGNTAIYMDGQAVKNLSDKGTVTLHAVWVEDVYSIRAYFSSDSDHSINAKLMRGDAQIGSAQSVTMSGNGAPYTGHFDFTGVPKGIYNIVAEQDDKVITKLIIITDHDDTVEITMPASEVNSVLDVSEDALPVVVGGLEDEAVTKAEESKTVTITMTVEKQEEQQLPDNASESEKATQEAIAEIKEEASGKTFEFMDIEVEKTVEEAGQADVSEKLTETNKVMEIVIPFDLTGKLDIAVYRHHNGQTEQLAENTTKADGTFYIDAVNHLIHVFSRKFSTYAIGYTEPAPYYPPVVSVHSCTSKCKVCGGCEDANCNENACKGKCRLLGMNFTDVADDKWYTEPVAYVYHHKMMEGVGNNLFDINGTTTRAMIVTILWRLEGEPVVNYLMQFEDVPAETWYTEAVRWAASEGIVEGYSDTAFGPTDPITREQFAAILWRYAKYKGYDVSVGEDTNILFYEDAFSISEYAYPALQWACGAGLMQGDGVNLTPKAEATRAQAAALFQRFCENVANKK